MLARIIFCCAVILATLAVVLLAVFSHVAHKRAAKNSAGSWLALSLYIQQPVIADSNLHPVAPPGAGALIFHCTLTEGPENTSRVIGRAQGFIIPLEKFANSAFNIIYLTVNTREHSGSISIQAKNFADKDKEELTIVGGTGSFGGARGFAVIAQTDGQTSNPDVPRRIKLYLKFPNRS